MVEKAQVQDRDTEELQDEVSPSQDDIQTTAYTTMRDRACSSNAANNTPASHYADVPSLYRSEGSPGPIQSRQNTHLLQRIASLARDRFSGWKMGMLLAISADLAILVVVLALTMYTGLSFPRNGYQATLIDHGCDSVRTWSTWLHLGVNLVCTVLLATSSYTMQCLTSPTRKEINQAHQGGKCMDIGVPSFANLLRIKPQRVLVWLLLLLSSLPLHLLANSAVYETQGANSYVMAVVEEDFISKSLCPVELIGVGCTDGLYQGYSYWATQFNSPLNVFPQLSWGDKISVSLQSNTTRLLKELVSRTERLENAECMRAYSQSLLSNRGSVLAVTSDKRKLSADSSYNYVNQLYYQSVDYCPDCQSYRYYHADLTLWLCAWLNKKNPGAVRGCSVEKAISRASEWTILDKPIEYCLSERADGQCQLQANIIVMVSVVICAIVKIVAIIAAFWTMPKEIIATVGDAVASFLQEREALSSQCSLLRLKDVHRRRWKPGTAFPKQWSASSLTKRWSHAPSVAQWLATMLFLSALLFTTISFFFIGRSRLQNSRVQAEDSDGIPVPTDLASIWRMGFGAVNINFLVTLPGMSSREGVIGNTLLVNTPQLVLSFSYFAYNVIWTQMLIAREWAQYGIRRRSLRVSSPRGLQRSNYFLTIPYQYAVPLLTVSVVLHWLLSQSFFLARINVNPAKPFVETPPAVINTVGYSLSALLMFFLVGLVVILVVVCFGMFMKLASPMPIVVGCSMAISAACHPLNEPEDMALMPLKWGLVGEIDNGQDKDNDGDAFHHCSFSVGEVASPADLPTPIRWTKFA